MFDPRKSIIKKTQSYLHDASIMFYQGVGMKQSGRYAVIFIAAMALWNTIIIKPLKILSVFFSMNWVIPDGCHFRER